MPKYDFKCEECSNEFEAVISPHEIKKVKCLKCNSLKTHKLLSAPGIILKGGGFYKNDSRAKSASKKNLSSSV